VLDTDLFGFFGFDTGGDVGECTLGGGAVLGSAGVLRVVFRIWFRGVSSRQAVLQARRGTRTCKVGQGPQDCSAQNTEEPIGVLTAGVEQADTRASTNNRRDSHNARTHTRARTLHNTHIPDLLDREIRIRRYARISPSATSSHIHNDHHWSRAETLEELGDFQIGGSQSGAGVIEPYGAFLGCMSGVRWELVL
jgi:hypothetical protein